MCQVLYTLSQARSADRLSVQNYHWLYTDQNCPVSGNQKDFQLKEFPYGYRHFSDQTGQQLQEWLNLRSHDQLPEDNSALIQNHPAFHGNHRCSHPYNRHCQESLLLLPHRMYRL